MNRSPLRLLFVPVMLALALVVLYRWHGGQKPHSTSPPVDFPSSPSNMVSNGHGGFVSPTWGPATPAQKAAVNRSIQAQLDAFRKNDFATAAKYQSPGLQANFQTTERFRQSMLRYYPQFCHFAKVKYGMCNIDGQGLMAMSDVTVISPDGVKTPARYMMARMHGQYLVVQVAPPAMLPPLDR